MPYTTLKQLNHFIIRHRLLIFLCLLLGLLVIFPFMQGPLGRYSALLELVFSLTLIMGIYIVSANKQLLTISVLLGAMIFTVIWFNLILQNHNLQLFGLVLEIVFFIMTTAVIISHVLSYRRVTADKIYGAICGYLLIGFVWALIYSLIEHANPGSFSMNQGLPQAYYYNTTLPNYLAHFIYFSFVTITTLGYGDITPITHVSRVLSAIEAVMGQLYIAILIARLVGLHISHSLRSDNSE